MADDGAVARYRTNLQGEVDSAALYRAMAEAEKDPHLSEVYRRLAAVEEAHAEFWRKQLGGIGATGLAHAFAGLARPALRTAIRAADPEHPRTARQRDVRPAARSRRCRVADCRALAQPHRRGDGGGVARGRH